MPTHTVLVMDDEKATRDAVRWTLEDAGYAVLEAPDGDEGLHLLRASGEEPLIVLLDLMMPNISGLEVLRAVGAEPDVACRHAFIIFSAVRAFIAPTLNLFLQGKHLFSLPKPFALEDLITTVEQAAQQLDSAHDDHTKAPVGEPFQAADNDDTQRSRGATRCLPMQASEGSIVTHTADYAADADAAADQLHPVSSGAGSDHLLQRRALLDAIVMRANALRTLHQQYMALPRLQEASHERREKLLQLLDAEQAVLAESQRLQEELDALLRVRRAMMVQALSPSSRSLGPRRR